MLRLRLRNFTYKNPSVETANVNYHPIAKHVATKLRAGDPTLYEKDKHQH